MTTIQNSTNISSCLLEGIQRLYKTKRFADVVVHVENQSFTCHRVVLSAVSAYFDAMFTSGMKEATSNSVSLHNIKPKVFQDILAYIYLGKDIVTLETVDEILQTSAMLQINCLQAKCEEFVMQNLDADNCIGVWKLGRAHNCEQLVNTSHPFILQNFDSVWESNDFLKLEKDDVDFLFRDELLNVTYEETICKALFRWISADETRKIAFPDLFAHIRLTSVGLEYILDELDQHPLVLQHKECTTSVKNAIKYHALPARRQTLMYNEKTYRTNADLEQVLAVIGRRSRENGSTKIEFVGYSFAKNRWFSLQSPPCDVGEDSACCAYGNDIFITGGTANMNICIRYSTKFSQWRERSPLTCGRYRHSMAAMQDSLFAFGGYNFGTLKSIEEYDMGTESWKLVGELHFGVDGSSAAVLGQKVFVIGGCLRFTEETVGIQCFDTKTYTCSHITNLPKPSKFSCAISVNEKIHIVCDDGEVMSYSAFEGHRAMKNIKNFSRRNFGLFVDTNGLYIIGGNHSVFSGEDDDLCNDVIQVTDEGGRLVEDITLPFRMEVLGCARTVVRKKYPLIDCQTMMAEFGDID